MKGIGKQIRYMDMENVDILMELFKKANGNILLLKENYRKSIIFKIKIPFEILYYKTKKYLHSLYICLYIYI